MFYAYLFEARGIQRFLFASGKLRDMLNGSELLDYICAPSGYLDQALERLQLTPTVVRQAGGSFYLVFSGEQDAKRFQAVWRLASAIWLPGLETVDALTGEHSAREAIEVGLNVLQSARNQLKPDLPRPGPFALRAPRTGLAATTRDRGEALDCATARQRQFNRPLDNHCLTARFMSQDAIWPVNFEADAPEDTRFPLGDQTLVGLVHADGNGLGEVLRMITNAWQLADDPAYMRMYRSFSESLTKATRNATDEACTHVLLPHAVNGVMPARPLVLGGDDLTLIVRADLALPFTRYWLEAFERHTESVMKTVKAHLQEASITLEEGDIPERLTACAGICFLKPSQPFQPAHELAASLCQRAKTRSRQTSAGGKIMPSCLAWHRVQESLIQDADTLFNRNHLVVTDTARFETALGVYAIHEGHGLPALKHLIELLAAFEDGLNDRPLREVATLIRGSTLVATRTYQRWHQRSTKHSADQMQRFDFALEQLVGSVEQDLPFSSGDIRRSPLDDILSLRTIIGESAGETNA